MTKQEEVKEGVQELIDKCYGSRNPDYPKLIIFRPQKFLNELFPYLHSQGVVIKTERELPKVEWTLTGIETPSQAQKISKAFRKAYAGYVAVEPLIKEV